MSLTRPLNLIFALTLLTGASLVHAADKLYQVEVIVFQHLATPAASMEYWSPTPGYPELDRAISPELAFANAGAIDLQAAAADEDAEFMQSPGARLIPLQQNEKTLGNAWLNLKRSSDYRPLKYLGWRQTGKQTDDGLRVRVRLGGGSGTDLATEPQRVDGWLKLERSVFLHVSTDVVYFPERLSTPEGNSVELVRMTERRKLKYNELNYLDHPLFGLLVRVSPVANPNEQEPDLLDSVELSETP